MLVGNRQKGETARTNADAQNHGCRLSRRRQPVSQQDGKIDAMQARIPVECYVDEQSRRVACQIRSALAWLGEEPTDRQHPSSVGASVDSGKLVQA